MALSTEVARFIGKGTPGIKFIAPALAGGAALLGVRKEKKAKNSHLLTIIKDREVAVRIRMGRARYDTWRGGRNGEKIVKLAQIAKPKKEGRRSIYFAWPFTDAFRVVSTEPQPTNLGLTKFRRNDDQWAVAASIEWQVQEDYADRAFLNTSDLHESVQYECEQQIGIAAEDLDDATVASGLAAISPALRAQLLASCAEPLAKYGVTLVDVRTSYYGPSDMQVLASGGNLAVREAVATTQVE